MSKIRLAINGFGRIGRQAFKIALANPDVQVVAVNDLTSPAVLAHLLRFDSVYGHYPQSVSATDTEIIVADESYRVYAEKDPASLPWGDLKIDVVLECTGRFTSQSAAEGHITAGARKVIISAPAKDDNTKTIVLSVNEHDYNGEAVISNASCTTNCITPVAAVLESVFGVEKMMMTTIHSYTAEQNLVDGPPPGGHSNDLRRARAAGLNIVPTTTGAAIAATKALPSLAGLFHGLSIRVPTAVGSLSDFTAVLRADTDRDSVNAAFVAAAKEPRFAGKLVTTTEPIVSSDIIGQSASAIVDLSLTEVVGGNLVKVVAWYDNEFGYSNRLVEEAVLVGRAK